MNKLYLICGRTTYNLQTKFPEFLIKKDLIGFSKRNYKDTGFLHGVLLILLHTHAHTQTVHT